jgi:hypothetical protein
MSLRTPHIYLRAEHNQAEFIRTHGARGLFGAAVVRVDHLAPFPEGHGQFSENGEAIADALEATGKPMVVDPFTPGFLCAAASIAPGARRLNALASAQGLQLPLDWRRLERPAFRDWYVDAQLALQARAAAVAAPYLESRGRGDLRHRINLAMLRRSVGASGSRLPVAFIQVTRTRMRQGVLSGIARDLADVGVARAFLRVRGLPSERASADDLRALFRAIDAFSGCGVELVPDAIGRLGAVLVFAGASGFSSGVKVFRSVPAQPFSKHPARSGPLLLYEVPGRWDGVDWRKRHLHLGRCPVEPCPADRFNAPSDAIRAHTLHFWRWQTRQALDDPLQFVRELRAAGRNGWADVVAERLELAA